MRAAPDVTRMYSVCVVCQWFCVVKVEPGWKLMVVGGVVGVLREGGGGKVQVVDVGGGRWKEVWWEVLVRGIVVVVVVV